MSAPAAVVTSDLDNTLVFGSRHNQAGVTTWCVENIDGAATAFVTARAHDLWRDLPVPLVPVTTRTRAQLGRLTLPRPAGILPNSGWAVCSNGGTVLHDGEPDAAWASRVRTGLAPHRPLGEVEAWFGRAADEPWVRALRTADGLFVYLVAQGREQIPATFAADCAAFVGEGWSVSVQGRKVYAVPTVLSKARAVEHVLERADWQGLPLLTAGDSLLDVDLLALGAASGGAWWPAHGELGLAPEVVPAGSTRLDVPGVLAGEALLDAWYACVAGLSTAGVAR